MSAQLALEKVVNNEFALNGKIKTTLAFTPEAWTTLVKQERVSWYMRSSLIKDGAFLLSLMEDFDKKHGMNPDERKIYIDNGGWSKYGIYNFRAEILVDGVKYKGEPFLGSGAYAVLSSYMDVFNKYQ